MARSPRVRGDCVYVPEGMPDAFDFQESPATTHRRLTASRISGKPGFDFARKALAKSDFAVTGTHEDTRPLRFAWYRLHFPTMAVHERYAAWKVEGGDLPVRDVVVEAPADDADNLAAIEVDAVNEVESADEAAESESDSSLRTAGKMVVDADAAAKNVVLTADPSCELDLGLPADVSLEEEIKLLKWVRTNAQHVLTKRVSLRKAPHQSCWWLTNIAILNPVAFEQKFWDRLMEYEKQREERIRSERGKLVDDGGKLSLLLRRLEASV